MCNCVHMPETPPISLPAGLIDKIMARTKTNGACIEYVGSRNDVGYGSVTMDGERYSVTRSIATHTYGAPPAGKPHCLHSCDNPPCCNPAHLRWGSVAENLHDMWSRGRRTTPLFVTGEKHHSARMTVDTVREVRERHANGETLSALGREFGVRPWAISKICQRITWRHVA